MQWRKEKFDNIEDVVLRPDRIWLPELALMNGLENFHPDIRPSSFDLSARLAAFVVLTRERMYVLHR